jgi:hypothetical protein
VVEALFVWSDRGNIQSAWAKEALMIAVAIPAVGLALVLGSLGLAGRLTGGIRPAEELHWSWAGLGRRLPGRLVWGLVWGFCLGFILGLFLALAFVLPDWEATSIVELPWGREVRGFARLPALALDFGVLFGVLFGVVFGLTAGLATELRDERARPNEGIRRSARYALTIGLSVVLIITLPSVPFAVGLADALLALGVGLIVGLAVGLVFGGAACVQHYRVRAALVRAGVAPWRYGGFLDAMTKRLLLRRSGSGYLFVHRLFRDYLADLALDQPPAAIRAAAAGR